MADHTPTPFKVRLTLDITYDLAPEWAVEEGCVVPAPHARTALLNRLNALPGWISGDGQMTGDLAVEVDTWTHAVEVQPC